MRTTPIERLKSRDELRARLRAHGIEPDTRQDGRPIIFALFPIVDHEFNKILVTLCLSLQNHFIAAAPKLSYSSPLRQITFSPILSEIMPAKKPMVVSHKWSESGVHIRVALDTSTWRGSDSKARRKALVAALVQGMSKVREKWLSEIDRAALIELFQSFARPQSRHAVRAPRAGA